MSALFGLVMGVIMRYGAIHHFDASPAEGLISYICGFILGYIIWESLERREARK